MDLSAVIVAAIGVLGVVGGQIVAKRGQRAEQHQRQVAERAAQEHQHYEEMRALLGEYRVDADRLRAEADVLQAQLRAEREQARLDLQALQTDARRLRSDLAAVLLVVRDEVMREAASEAWDLPREDR